MHIVFITGNYPTLCHPTSGTFVQQFVWAIARQGIDCTVINPTSLFDRRYGPYPLRYSIEDAGGGKKINLYRPYYISFSSKNLGWAHTGRWTQCALNFISRRAVGALVSKPDVLYGHFLYNAGRAAVFAGIKHGIPSVIGVGEGTFWTVDPFGFDQAKRDFRTAAGFIAVGQHIQTGLSDEISIPLSKIIVEPNGVDRTLFFKADQCEARLQLGLEQGLFIIAFVGTFDDLKGGQELLSAVDGMSGMSLAMIGRGEKSFDSPNIIFKGTVNHSQITTWLNAADIFVLPTREEGSCNAVIEAMACGLPIVTSNGRYMDDIVDDEVAIRVDPIDVLAIREAILLLKNDPDRRKRMSIACLKKAKKFDINERARRVTAWMEELVKKKS